MPRAQATWTMLQPESLLSHDIAESEHAQILTLGHVRFAARLSPCSPLPRCIHARVPERPPASTAIQLMPARLWSPIAVISHICRLSCLLHLAHLPCQASDEEGDIRGIIHVVPHRIPAAAVQVGNSLRDAYTPQGAHCSGGLATHSHGD